MIFESRFSSSSKKCSQINYKAFIYLFTESHSHPKNIEPSFPSSRNTLQERSDKWNKGLHSNIYAIALLSIHVGIQRMCKSGRRK